jgi:hypothetical protein
MGEIKMQMQKMFLKAEAIYKYLLGISDKLDTLIMCKPQNTVLTTYDQSLYEALGAIDRDKIDYNKLVKFLEAVDIQSFKEKMGERKILKQERVEELKNSLESEKND